MAILRSIFGATIATAGSGTVEHVGPTARVTSAAMTGATRTVIRVAIRHAVVKRNADVTVV